MEQRYHTLTIAVQEQLFAAIEQAAAAEERPRSAQVRQMLKEALARRGLWDLAGRGAPPESDEQ